MANLNGKMLRDYQYPIVKALMNGTHRYVIVLHPRASGKSLLGFYTANTSINKHKDRICHWLIIAKEKGQTTRIYAKNILENGQPLFSLLPPGGKYSRYDGEIRYENGSTIEFNGSDNIDSIVGGRYDGIICDEFATWKEGNFDLLFPCLRQDGKSILMIMSTARGKNHFWKKLQEIRNNPDKYPEWLTGHSSVIDLGIMTQAQYDSLPLDPNYKAQEFMCDVEASFVGAIFSKPNLGHNLFVPGLPIHIGLDIAEMNDANVFCAAQIVQEKIHIIFISKFIRTRQGEIINEVKANLERLRVPLHQVILYPPHDAHRESGLTGLTRVEQLQQEGFECMNVPLKGVMDGIQLVRSFWHQIIFDEEECKEGIEDIKAYRSDDDGKPDVGRANHKFSHVPDALRYLCIGLEYYGIIKGWRVQVEDPMSQYSGAATYRGTRM